MYDFQHQCAAMAKIGVTIIGTGSVTSPKLGKIVILSFVEIYMSGQKITCVCWDKYMHSNLQECFRKTLANLLLQILLLQCILIIGSFEEVYNRIYENDLDIPAT